MVANAAVKNVFGNIQMCAKALKPAASAAAPAKEKKKQEQKPKEEKKEAPKK